MGSMPFYMLIITVTSFTTITVLVSATDNPALEIKPDLPVIIQQAAKSLSLTCRPRVSEPNLISQLEWRDSVGRLIANTDQNALIHVAKLTNETGILLVFPNPQNYLDGIYKCKAFYGSTLLETRVRVVTIDGNPVTPQIFELFNITASIGSDTKVICKANGRPTPKVLFKKLNKADLFQIGSQPFDDRILIENINNNAKGETYGILTIRNLSRADDGLYECIADNEIGKAFRIGHITVEFPPVFNNNDNVNEVWTWQNNPVKLTCVAESIPNSTIKWRYNSNELDRDNPSLRIEGYGPKSHLIVTPGSENKLDAHYECVAMNRLGQNHKMFSLKSADPPCSISQVKVNTVTPTTIKFEIVRQQLFSEMPLKAFICKYRRIDQTSDFAKNITWNVNASYIINNLEPQKTYHFTFAAVNDVGIGSWSGPNLHFTMPRRGVPAEPIILVTLGGFANVSIHEQVIVSSYADRYELRWNVSNDNGHPLDYYIIRYCETHWINGEWKDSESKCCSEIIEPTFQSYEMKELQPDTTYNIELRAHNALGASTTAQMRVKTIVEAFSGSNSSTNSFNLLILFVYAVFY
nr:fasciclin-2-like [Onthophagus taurus]XP_022908724.1 fasciclin-2-like [Onthophagus taurus]